ncbi:aldo/keto reductase [Dietzia sp.]|uniref:aldo/keto reductase n=1 Tax=Dietzia sp. TaxID=1871616 RepID=UPI002FD9F9AB
MTLVPEFTLPGDVKIPAIGFGVYQTPPEETVASVERALQVGYRHIDTAAAYGNERQVGEAIRNSGLDRDDVFIETKVWVTDYGYDETLHAFSKAAGKLGVDTIDLLLLHQPIADDFDRVVAAYTALEKLLDEGAVRAIGVSNFTPAQLEKLDAATKVTPAVNQVELHPYFTQLEQRDADARRGILTQAWSPIGGITKYRDGGAPGRVAFEDPVLLDIAEAHGKTPAQVMLRWHLQQGRQVIPKSTNPGRIAENFEVFDFELAVRELTAIDDLDTGKRSGPDPEQPQPAFFENEIPEA